MDYDSTSRPDRLTGTRTGSPLQPVLKVLMDYELIGGLQMITTEPLMPYGTKRHGASFQFRFTYQAARGVVLVPCSLPWPVARNGKCVSL
jgi:hypothetical protein